MCVWSLPYIVYYFFFNDTATTEIYTLSLHDALPIYRQRGSNDRTPRMADHDRPLDPEFGQGAGEQPCLRLRGPQSQARRSEEHTSELQSRQYLVCRLLLEKKKKTHT